MGSVKLNSRKFASCKWHLCHQKKKCTNSKLQLMSINTSVNLKIQVAQISYLLHLLNLSIRFISLTNECKIIFKTQDYEKNRCKLSLLKTFICYSLPGTLIAKIFRPSRQGGINRNLVQDQNLQNSCLPPLPYEKLKAMNLQSKSYPWHKFWFYRSDNKLNYTDSFTRKGIQMYTSNSKYPEEEYIM